MFKIIEKTSKPNVEKKQVRVPAHKQQTPAEIAKERIIKDRKKMMDEILRKRNVPFKKQQGMLENVFPRQADAKKKEALRNIFKSQL